MPVDAASRRCVAVAHCRVNWKLQNISQTGSGDYQLTYETPEGTKQIMTRQVALTIPAYTAADLLQKQCVSGSLSRTCWRDTCWWLQGQASSYPR